MNNGELDAGPALFIRGDSVPLSYSFMINGRPSYPQTVLKYYYKKGKLPII